MRTAIAPDAWRSPLHSQRMKIVAIIEAMPRHGLAPMRIKRVLDFSQAVNIHPFDVLHAVKRLLEA